MTWLLYKEYIQLKDSLIGYGKLLLFYWLLAWLGLYPLWVAVSLGQFLLILAPLVLFIQESRENFHHYLYTVPQGPVKMVKSRYLFALFLGAISTQGNLLLLILWQLWLGGDLPLRALMLSALGGFFLLFISLPLCYHLGGERARPWFYMMVLIPLVFYVLFRDSIAVRMDFLHDSIQLRLFLTAVVALVILGYFSYRQSLSLLLEKNMP